MPVMTVETTDHVDLITLRRPEVMNALNYELYDALEAAVRESEARAIVITGEGKGFCSGDDAKEILSKGVEGANRGEGPSPPARLTPAADALLHTDIPVIAAVNGFALGWGMELALMADLRVASTAAKFGELFVERGLCCDAPGLGRLAQLVGREKASELLFTGAIIDAETAERIGLVSRVVEPDDLVPQAMALAKTIAAKPPLAVQSLKRGLRRTLDPDWHDVGRWAITEIRTLMGTADAKESAAAFMEKREPKFTGA